MRVLPYFQPITSLGTCKNSKYAIIYCDSLLIPREHRVGGTSYNPSTFDFFEGESEGRGRIDYLSSKSKRGGACWKGAGDALKLSQIGTTLFIWLMLMVVSKVYELL